MEWYWWCFGVGVVIVVVVGNSIVWGGFSCCGWSDYYCWDVGLGAGGRVDVTVGLVWWVVCGVDSLCRWIFVAGSSLSLPGDLLRVAGP